MRRLTLTTALLAAGALALPSGAAAWPNPANDPALLNQPIEESVYDDAHRCVRKARPGARLLEKWMGRHFPGESWGIVRCEKLSKDSMSLHSEGRALDWHLDAKNKRDRRAANFLIQRLLEPDALGNTNALARRMGVQEIIFNCRSWFSGSETLGDYSGCHKGVDRTTAHRDHVHIGLSVAGGEAQTSFWKSGFGNR